jgi:hypothetical protein
MAAAKGKPSDAEWDTPEMATISPRECIAIRDDTAILEIVARKIAVESELPSYRVALSSE